MKATAIACLLLAIAIGMASADVFRATPNLFVPDNNPNGVSTSLEASPSCIMTDVDIAIEMGHSWIGDLIFRVIHGPVVTIIDRPGVPASTFGCSGNLQCNTQIVMDDEAGTPIEGACPAVFSGPYSPNQPLSAFDGGDQAGTWTLFVSDNAGGDTGTVCAWEVRTACTPTPVQATTWGGIKARYEGE